jgi:SAM-dependent methyltransferase
VKSKSKLPLNLKYDYYERSVQNAEVEVEFMVEKYKNEFGKKPRTMREDFCGTGAISCEWVNQGKDWEAYGVDLDPEPIALGKERNYSKLGKDAQKRMRYLKQNVLDAKAPKVDVICAFNFSYFIFKERQLLLKYFKSVRKSLNKKGIFYIDLFGGPESQKLVTDTKKMKGLTYYWECQYFNPITHDCKFAIHFKDKSGKKFEDVFTYEWRFWTLPELMDILREAGFSKVDCFWEGDDDEGGGNGEFDQAVDAENCDAWVSYIGAVP